jgi:hypothetical protein
MIYNAKHCQQYLENYFSDFLFSDRMAWCPQLFPYKTNHWIPKELAPSHSQKQSDVAEGQSVELGF